MVVPEVARLLLKLRRSIVPRYTEAQIFDEYNRQAVERGLNIIKSPTTVKNYLNDPAVMPMWYAAVHGMQKWKAKYTGPDEDQPPADARCLVVWRRYQVEPLLQE